MSSGAAPVFESCWGRTMHVARLAEWIPNVFLLAVDQRDLTNVLICISKLLDKSKDELPLLLGFIICSQLSKAPQTDLACGNTNIEYHSWFPIDHDLSIAAVDALLRSGKRSSSPRVGTQLHCVLPSPSPLLCSNEKPSDFTECRSIQNREQAPMAVRNS